MEKLLKSLGIALVILGAVLLILPMLLASMADLADENWYTFGGLILIIAGVIVHIIMNKILPY